MEAEGKKGRHDRRSCLPWGKERLESILGIDGTVVGESPNGPSGPRAEWRVNSRPVAGNCAGAALPTPSIQIPKGEAALRAVEPKKKDTLLACLSFWKGRLKSIFFQGQTKPKSSEAGSVWKRRKSPSGV